MAQYNTVFSQLLKLIPRREIDTPAEQPTRAPAELYLGNARRVWWYVLGMVVMLLPLNALAIAINFNITGVDGDGVLNLNFIGSDRGLHATVDPLGDTLGDGQISHLVVGNTELDTFSATLTGGDTLGNLTFGFPELTGFQYRIPGPGESLASGLLGLRALFNDSVNNRLLELRAVDGVYDDANLIEIAVVGGDTLVILAKEIFSSGFEQVAESSVTGAERLGSSVSSVASGRVQGVDSPDVGPGVCTGEEGSDNSYCRFEVVDEGLGRTVSVIFKGENLQGIIDWDELPTRVEDTRAHCAPGYAEAPPVSGGELSLTGFEIARGVDLVIPTHVCGVVRNGENGPVVSRDNTGGNHGTWLDIVGINTTIIPTTENPEILGTTLDGTAFECQDPFDTDTATPLQDQIGYTDNTQCVSLINARVGEAKYTYDSGGGVMAAQPVARQLVRQAGVSGSYMGSARALSWLVYNTTYAPNIDYEAILGAEVTALKDTVYDTRVCVPGDPTGGLWYWESFTAYAAIQSFYDAASASGATMVDNKYQGMLALVEQWSVRLEGIGPGNDWTGCFVDADDLVTLLNPADVVPADIPRNPYGDYLAQLGHVRMMIRAFMPLPPST